MSRRHIDVLCSVGAPLQRGGTHQTSGILIRQATTKRTKLTKQRSTTLAEEAPKIAMVTFISAQTCHCAIALYRAKIPRSASLPPGILSSSAGRSIRI
ncbi:uncharacterized protein N7479_003532 [Penicillium vulpinum]|uniref:uncharacterized protein n=1 Tax=Penicillium vulpinum TaxID=29845 RepID=UPI0025469F3B|nr:uncharacterized protein N7479_003532 [Penicillium vulpinum]KAJ5963656.1 hypothetical protein N7479_003532 [Penicillium vulpinum]